MSATPSFFAIYRLVAIMLARDGIIDPREKAWFVWLMNRYQLSPEQQTQALADLENPPRLDEIYPQIQGLEDRLQMVQWLRRAMNIDGECKPSELAFFNEVLAIDRGVVELNSTYRDLATSLIE